MIHKIIINILLLGVAYSAVLIQMPATRPYLMNQSVLYAAIGITALCTVIDVMDEKRAEGEEEEKAGEA